MMEDYNFFIENLAFLYEKFGPAYVSIKSGQVLGSYKTLEEAVLETAKNHALGTFIVQQLAENHESLVAHFAGNIA